MTKLPRKLLSLLLALMLTAGAVLSAPLTANAADAQGKVYPTIMNSFYGDCGTDTTYYCFPDGSMAIFGTGAIADYSLLNGNTTAPWYRLGMDSMVQQIMIHKIFVEYGVTRIGDYSFYLSQANSRIILYNLDIANTVTSIGKYAFWGQALEEIIIPPSVIEIGEQAFGNMKNLSRIVCYANPKNLNWDNIVDAKDPKTEVHVLTGCEGNLPTASNVTFVADLTDPYASADTKERNITAFYGSVNSHIFGGSAPYIIVGKYDNVKKSVTYGNAGFATCVYYNDAYYALTDNHTGKLYKAVINDQSHKIERCTDEIAPFSLFITHEYVGPNTVKMIYTLKNTGKDEISLKLGSAGDIKIGADDNAALKPITEDGTQVGFYMRSGNDVYDKTTQGGDEHATLGFIGKNVLIDQNNTASESAPATFFYGPASATYAENAAGVYTLTLYPDRIFNKNSNSQETGDLTGVDSGMSFYWDNITLPANDEKKFAVLFSVYGSSGDEAQQTLIDDSQATDSDFVTVTWDLADDDTNPTIVQQVIKKNERPVYPGATPIKPDSAGHYYLFSNWLQDVQTDTEIHYTAQYTATAKERLFKAHSISLHGDIALNFYLGAVGDGDVTEADLENGNVKVNFEWKVNDKIKTADVTLTSENRQVIDDKTYFVATCNVPAAEMAYNIHATAYVKKNGEWEQHWDNDRYSVKEYGMDLLKSSTATDLQKNMVRKMLYYGSMAQIQFDRIYADLGLADGELSDAELTELNTARNAVTSDDIQTTINDANPGKSKTDMRTIDKLGLKYYGSSVIYLTTTTLRHYFKITDASQSGSWETASNFSFALDANYPTYYVHYDMEDIYASKLDEYQKFTFNGTDYYFSALDYSNAVLHSDKAPEAEKNLAKATYLYNQAANELFDQGQPDAPTPNP